MSQLFDALKRSGAMIPALDSPSEPARDQGVDALDHVPCFQPHLSEHHRLAVLSDAPNMGAEKIRMLTTRLCHLQRKKGLKTVLITSSIKDEGKSVLAANIAISLAGTQQRVLLLDGDCHQSSLAALLGTTELAGLEGWWRLDRPIANYLTKMRTLPLWFLAAGRPFRQTVEMLQSPRLSALLSQLADTFDWVIIDSPPLAPLADAGIWSNLADATLLVVRPKRTPTKVLSKVLDSIDKRKLLGVVMNDCTDRHLSYYSQYYKQMLPQKDSHRKHATNSIRDVSFSPKKTDR